MRDRYEVLVWEPEKNESFETGKLGGMLISKRIVALFSELRLLLLPSVLSLQGSGTGHDVHTYHMSHVLQTPCSFHRPECVYILNNFLCILSDHRVN